eukprot:7201222-Alexandrium_andersonii.AAC.1
METVLAKGCTKLRLRTALAKPTESPEGPLRESPQRTPPHHTPAPNSPNEPNGPLRGSELAKSGEGG